MGATLLWKPTAIASDLCSTASPSPAPTPAPATADCSKKNKQVVLQSLATKKKVKTAKLCQKFCSAKAGATHFKLKWNKKVSKRVCYCHKIGLKTKKNFYAGPVSC